VPRPILYRKIDRRVEDMFRAGLIEEVQALIERYPKSCHAFKAIGYRETVEHLEGKTTLAQAIEKTQRESRRYAKRQLTWLRADSEIIWLDGTMTQENVEQAAMKRIEGFLEGLRSPQVHP